MNSLFRKLKRRLVTPGKLGSRSPIRMVWDALTFPFRLIGKLLVLTGSGLVAWWKSRHWRCLAWGLPALAVIVTAATSAMFASSVSRFDLAVRYKEQGKAAMNASQWERAKLCFERCVELGVRDQESLFELAKAAEKTGDEQRKAAVLSRLAPDDVATFAPAHLWKAATALSKSPVTPDRRTAAEKHLRFALQLDPDNEPAHALLGEMYFQSGLMSSAAPHLSRVARRSPRFRMLYAKALLATGAVTQATSMAEAAVSDATTLVTENPRDIPTRLELGDALAFLERFEPAASLLQEGLTLNPDSLELRAALARVYVLHADKILAGPEEIERKRIVAFQLVAAAMQLNPDDRHVFNRMMELVTEEDDASTEARKFLTANIANGRALGMSHLLLGTSLQKNGDLEQAVFHLEQAFQLMPEAPIVANNLAWYLVHSEPSDPQRAMKLIEAIIERFPDEPAYIDTRGHVHLALKKWKEAVDDLQISLQKFPKEQSVHDGLSKAYRELGMIDLANQHAAIASKLAGK